MKKKILITGSKGFIGKSLSAKLSKDYKLTLVDLPEVDIRDYSSCMKIFPNHDVIIHLAWNTKGENCFKKKINPSIYRENSKMYKNVYRAALESGIPRVIMASSVHADDFRNPLKIPLTPFQKPSPLNPYGKHKIEMEQMGKKYSRQGLEVICVRFGAVGNDKPTSKEGSLIWLTLNDCSRLMKSIIESNKVPNNFLRIYGISNNYNKIHDLSNPFKWKPLDGS